MTQYCFQFTQSTTLIANRNILCKGQYIVDLQTWIAFNRKNTEIMSHAVCIRNTLLCAFSAYFLESNYVPWYLSMKEKKILFQRKLLYIHACETNEANILFFPCTLHRKFSPSFRSSSYLFLLNLDEQLFYVCVCFRNYAL